MTIDKSISPEPGTAAPGNSPMLFRLDPGSGVPTYLQLVQQVEQSLLLGSLAPGDQLPKVRDVVADLAINPNTVLKAYRELEHKRIATGRPGQGTFIQSDVTRAGLPELSVLRRRLLRWLTEAQDAGIDDVGIAALFNATLRDFAERRPADGAGAATPVRTRKGGGAA